jgi:hypothetical protein
MRICCLCFSIVLLNLYKRLKLDESVALFIWLHCVIFHTRDLKREEPNLEWFFVHLGV